MHLISRIASFCTIERDSMLDSTQLGRSDHSFVAELGVLLLVDVVVRLVAYGNGSIM